MGSVGNVKLSCITWNVHSLTGKCRKVMEHVLDHNADIVFVTETWQTTMNNKVTATVKEYGYTLYHTIRNHDTKSRAGGVGLLCSTQLDVKKKNMKLGRFHSFEYVVYSLKTKSIKGKNYPVLLSALYRDQYVDIDVFLDEFEKFLQKLILTNSFLVISGDFNIHWGSTETDAVKFSELLETYNMKQHVAQPTNAFNNILDLVVTSNYDIGKTYKCPSVSDVSVTNVHLSDHFLIGYKINLKGSKKKSKTIYYRHYKTMNKLAFRDDISEIITENMDTYHESPFGVRTTLLNSSLFDTLNYHAPLKQKIVKHVPGSTWFNHDYVVLRRERRRAEKRAKKTGLTIDRDLFVELRNKTTMFAES